MACAACTEAGLSARQLQLRSEWVQAERREGKQLQCLLQKHASVSDVGISGFLAVNEEPFLGVNQIET